jgi:CSLREA domain-containing protein
LKVFVSLLIAVGCLLAVPVSAAAALYTVDSLGDQGDETKGANGCKTSVNTCTLRAAIDEANFDSAADTIKFSPIFNGQVADTIELGSSLPAIEFPLTIDGDAEGVGGQCTTEAGEKGPCAGVNGPVGGAALIVEDADKVSIEGLALTGALGGGSGVITVIESSEEFKAADNWLGIKLDGASAGNTKGIYLDPGSDKAVIGGVNATERNVIANIAFEGLDLEGASDAVIQGNYFGVEPDGVTPAVNSKNIEISDTLAFEATGNEVGATIEGAALATPACDGGCNVVAGNGLINSTGIDLEGNGELSNEAPASGPTTVHGNFVGLGADGTTVLANGTFDILVGAAAGATIGGESAGDANYIAAGGYGIYHEEGEDFEALGNAIGVNAAEAAVASPSAAGIFVYSPATVDAPLLEGNLVRMDGGFGIEQRTGGAVIAENLLVGGAAGIYAKGLGPAVGNLIEDNLSFEAEENGILIEGDLNQVLGNEVVLSEAAGIKVRQAGPPFTSPTTENLIGGDTASDENLIFGSGGDAIEIVDLEGSQNEVARNRGSGNGGLFIDLLAFEPGSEPNGPNGGIKPPAISTAEQSEAAGSAQPGATVRVFRKASAQPGEINSFLGEAVANGSGDWKVGYPAISGASIIAATQTSAAGGTSELSTASTPPDPAIVVDPEAKKSKGDDPKPGKDRPGCNGKPARFCHLPETTITKGPKARTHATTVKFKFSSNEQGAKFECKLDRKPFKACKSPKTYKKLKPGKHVFKVRAVKGKSVDPTPAKRKFKILA